MTEFSLCYLLAVASWVSFVSGGPVPIDLRSKTYYNGFQSIKYLFTFGDSYTTTGFNATTGPQPSPSNPLGNPTYPGSTSSDGPNWVDYLTVQYNQSHLLTYDLAYGGATVDSSLVAPYLPTVLSLRQQIEDEYLPTYGNKTNAHLLNASWTSSNALFGIFIGINDVGNSYTESNSTTVINPAVFSVYHHLVEELYSSGARNFFFLNVPPVNRSPLTTASGYNASVLEALDIQLFNEGILDLATRLSQRHPDTTVFHFDTNTLFNIVLDNPKAFPETALYRNTTEYCVEYENGTSTTTTYIPSCYLPVNEYFWLNTLHPTYPMQHLLGKEVAAMLELKGWDFGRQV